MSCPYQELSLIYLWLTACPQKKLAEALAKTFKYYKVTWQLYHEDRAGSSGPKAKTTAEALEFIDRGVDVMTRAQARIKMALEEFSTDPILVQPWGIDRCSQLRGEDWGSGWLWKAADFVGNSDEAVVAKFKSLSKSPVESIRRTANRIIKDRSE